jgi:hypothetical protein
MLESSLFMLCKNDNFIDTSKYARALQRIAFILHVNLVADAT